MARNDPILLTSDELIVLADFLRSLDTQSIQTKEHLSGIFKTFTSEVGLANISDESVINGWVKTHEIDGKVNNNTRYFLIKFANYLGVDKGPLTVWKLKRLETDKNPKVFSEREKDLIIRSALKLTSKYCSAMNFYYYLRLIDEGALRKSEPLNIVYNDFLIRNGQTSVLIRGKGNRQRWIIIPSILYADIIDYCENNKIDGDDILFDFSIENVNMMYDQVCKHAKFEDMRMKNLDDKDAHKNYSIRLNYEVGPKKRNTFRWEPVYSLHKFRRFRIQEWHKKGVPLVEIMHRAGHSTLETTKIYINEGEDKMLENWDKQINKDFEEKEIAAAAERMRDKI